MSKDNLLCCVKAYLETIVSVDLSQLELYYDGPAEEEKTSSGKDVSGRPVWYGGLDSNPESLALSVYEFDDRQICVSLRRFFKNGPFEDTDIMLELESA